MTTYYVDPVSGDNGDDGLTKPTAWATPQYAADNAVNPGDVVIYMDGTWTMGSTTLDFDTNSGSSGNEIIHQAENQGSAILQWSGAGRRIDIDNVTYLQLIGLIIDGGSDGDDGIRIGPSNTCNHITIQNCTVRDVDGFGIRATNSSDNITVDNCTVDPNDPSLGPNNDAILFYGGSDIIVSNCTAKRSTHDGIQFVGVSTGEISGNTVTAHGSHGIELDALGGTGCSNITIRDNVCYGDPAWTAEDPHGMKTGIFLNGADHSSIEIYRNVTHYCSGDGIYISDGFTGPIDIWNNTIHDVNRTYSGACFRIYNIAGTPTLEFQNNILFVTQNGEESVRTTSVDETNYALDYNLHFFDSGVSLSITRDGSNYTTWSAYQTAGFEANSVNGADDPDFKDAANDDFTLKSDSPARNIGTDVGLTYYGPFPDAGAHETVSNTTSVNNNRRRRR